MGSGNGRGTGRGKGLMFGYIALHIPSGSGSSTQHFPHLQASLIAHTFDPRTGAVRARVAQISSGHAASQRAFLGYGGILPQTPKLDLEIQPHLSHVPVKHLDCTQI